LCQARLALLANLRQEHLSVVAVNRHARYISRFHTRTRHGF
jgi:hypothetical protein